jgi:tetratricopeptide (TPR) repeat protein
MDSASPSVHPDDKEPPRAPLLERRQQLTDALSRSPYDLILYLERAVVYSNLAYPDLAAGDAYRALLLADEVRDESFEYHEQAKDALRGYKTVPCPEVLNHGCLVEDLDRLMDGDGAEAAGEYNLLSNLASVRCFQILSISLLLCGSLKSALSFCERGLAMVPHNRELQEIREYIEQVARRRLRKGPEEALEINSLPDRGVVRREVYPWNTHEPDRFAEESLSFLNERLAGMAPKCEVKVSSLPMLLDGESSTDSYDIIPTCNQLGLFAKEDIGPGEPVLEEYSLLTANNRHKESACDACGTELPPLASSSKAVSCPECYDTIFCDEFCSEQAQGQYHPAVCDKDVDSIAKDPDAGDIDQSLYLLLLARLLAMSTHQEIHPLEIKEIKYSTLNLGLQTPCIALTPVPKYGAISSARPSTTSTAPSQTSRHPSGRCPSRSSTTSRSRCTSSRRWTLTSTPRSSSTTSGSSTRPTPSSAAPPRPARTRVTAARMWLPCIPFGVSRTMTVTRMLPGSGAAKWCCGRGRRRCWGICPGGSRRARRS